MTVLTDRERGDLYKILNDLRPAKKPQTGIGRKPRNQGRPVNYNLLKNEIL